MQVICTNKLLVFVNASLKSIMIRPRNLQLHLPVPIMIVQVITGLFCHKTCEVV